MSQFSKKPYIEAVLSELSGDNKIKLLNFVNGLNADGTSDISYVSCTTISALRSQSSGVTPVDYLYSSRIHWKGYLVKTTNFTVFLTFKNAIDLNMADVYEVLTNGLNLKESIMSDYLRALLSENEYIDNAELIASLATKADKVTVDSIVHDEDEGLLIFPKGVMPLKVLDDAGTKYYFDYSNKMIVNDTGTEFGTDTIVITDNGEIAMVTDDMDSVVISSFDYILFDGQNLELNTYKLYYPAPSGTKLYRHQFDVKDGSDVKASFTIYALRSDSICNNGDYLGFKASNFKNCQPIAIYITISGESPALCIKLVNQSVIDLVYYTGGSLGHLSEDFEGYTTTTDIVTEL